MGQARVRRKGEAALIEIWVYIAVENFNAADNLVDLIDKKVAPLHSDSRR